MYDFNFRGRDSFKDFGICVAKRPPITSPQRNIEYIEIPGRNGALKVDDETYKDIVIPVECWFKSKDIPGKTEEIKQWLDGGEGPLIFSNQPDRFYIAHVSDQFDIAQEMKRFGQFQLNFRCRPFKYAVDNHPITLASPGALISPGNQPSEPIIQVNGSGNITLTINSISVLLSNVSGHVTIDSILKDAYKDTTLKNNDMTGDFPMLRPGENTISWTGTVTTLEITPNWRWL